MTETTPFLPGLSPLRRKPLTAEQDAGNLTSNGGLILLRESALRSGVAAVVADAVPDRRCQLLVTHSYRAMVTARMMAIAAGHYILGLPINVKLDAIARPWREQCE